MKYRIWGILEDGSEDSFIMEGDSLEDIQMDAMLKVVKMGMNEFWSEEIE